MPRYKAIIEYDGTNYYGFHLQSEVKTIASCLNQAIFNMSGEKANVTCAGRTDSGVHAYGQVIHFDLNKNFAAKILSEGLNHYLKSENISIIKITKCNKDFNARFNAKTRHYEYLILNRRIPSPLLKNHVWHFKYDLDLSKMQEAAKYLIGTHDLSSFRASECQAKSPIRTINEIKITKNKNIIKIKISAPAFLHNQVRIIVGTLAEIATGKKEIQDMQKIIIAKDRTQAGITAPASGLYFMKVEY